MTLETDEQLCIFFIRHDLKKASEGALEMFLMKNREHASVTASSLSQPTFFIARVMQEEEHNDGPRGFMIFINGLR